MFVAPPQASNKQAFTLVFTALCIVVIAVTAHLVESGCGKSSVHVSDVIIACPLNMDVSKSRHSIVIARHVNRIRQETVLSCVWNGKACPHCVSISGWELLGNLTHQVLAKVPVSKLHNDSSYTCQEVPPKSENPHNDCQVITISQHGPGTDDLLTTGVPETQTTTDKSGLSTTADELNTSTPQTTTDELNASTPRNRDVQTSAENQRVFCVALLSLTINMICLLLLIPIVTLIFLYRRHMMERLLQSKGRNLKDFQDTPSCKPMTNKGVMEKTVVYSPCCSAGRCDFGEECAEDVGDVPVDVTSDKGEVNNMGITLIRRATLEKCPETVEFLHKEQI